MSHFEASGTAHGGEGKDPLEDAVHLWFVHPEGWKGDEAQARLLSLLSPAERERWEAFRFSRDRLLYLTAHGMLRCVLSRYGGLSPRQWRFVTNRYGRPEIVAAQNRRSLRFNLSHTAGLAVCLVNRVFDAGVDVERNDRLDDPLSIADRYFSPLEVRDLRRRPREEHRERFFTLWTLKEAYIKARGMGLSIPLHHFSFEIGDRIGISFDPALRDDPSRWHFEVFHPTPHHTLACALGRGPLPVPRIERFLFTPAEVAKVGGEIF